MHPRFAKAPRAHATIAGERLDLVIAESQRLRFLGLMRLDADEIEPLLFPRCRSIHMYWMRAAIDIVWLDLDRSAGRAEVLSVCAELVPGERAGAPKVADRDARKRVAALELPSGRAGALGLAEGSTFELRIEVGPSG